jgi:hypothetical protein
VTKRRRRLIGLLALAALAGTVAVPAVHWRLIGWARGEPFYRGRPASYWRAEVAACDVGQVGCPGLVLGDAPPRPPTIYLEPRSGPLDLALQWLAEHLGLPGLRGPDEPPLGDGDASAAPVLIALTGDPDPKVRCYAAQSLGRLHLDGRPAIPALRRLLDDRSAVLPEITVAGAAAYAIYLIDPAALQAASRP